MCFNKQVQFVGVFLSILKNDEIYRGNLVVIATRYRLDDVQWC